MSWLIILSCPPRCEQLRSQDAQPWSSRRRGENEREWAAQCFPHPSAGTWGQFALGHQTRNTDRQCDHQPRCSTRSSPPPWGGTWTTTRRCTTCRCSHTSSQTSSQTSTVSQGGEGEPTISKWNVLLSRVEYVRLIMTWLLVFKRVITAVTEWFLHYEGFMSYLRWF